MSQPPPVAAAASERWSTLLDEMEAGLECVPPVVVNYLSATSGPLPPALRERAAATLCRMAQAEAALEQEKACIARELIGLAAARTAAARSAAPNVPRFLDTRA